MAAGSGETPWDALIGDLYSACWDTEAAARVAPAISTIFNAGTAAIWQLDFETAALAGRILTNFEPENLALYAEHWHAYDPWTLPLARQPGERAVRGSELIPDEELLRHPFYAEYGVKTGHFHVMGSILRLDGGASEIGAIAVQRPRHLGGFDDEEFRLLQRLLPHARRAVQLDARMRWEMLPLLAGRAALDAMSAAAIVLNGAGVVLHANEAAEALDREGQAIRLRRLGEDGRIAALRPADTNWLREAVADAARGGPGGARRLNGLEEKVYAAVVTPLPRRLADQEERSWLPGMALLVLRLIDPLAAPARLEELCMGLFGLTRSEAQVACLIAAGMSPEEIAGFREVRVSTVRTLLTRAMDKSGARNLRHFVNILAALPN